MSGTRHVDCTHCGRRFTTTADQARAERVLRCACGQFVRLDRAFPELRSEPLAARAFEDARHAVADEAEDEEDEQTHMLSSLSAVAAMSGRVANRSSRASMPPREEELVSRPVASGTRRSVTPPPYASSTDKVGWFVDLGGREPSPMSTEELILARRSGKLADGVLVWREGMASWRPVGTLISAVSISERPPAPEPEQPRKPAPPPSQSPLESYERPAPTLEFALEKPVTPPPAREPSRITIPPPSRVPVRASAPRARPSLPSIPALRAVPNTPLPAARPESISVPPPPPPPPPEAQLIAASEPAPSARPTDPPRADAFAERPLWMTACIGLAVCVVAASAGALLVRSLKPRPEPTALPVTSASLSAAKPAPVATQSAPVIARPSDAPRVVDLESLSVERRAPRVRPRAPRIAPSEAAKTDSSETPEPEAQPKTPEETADQPEP